MKCVELSFLVIFICLRIFSQQINNADTLQLSKKIKIDSVLYTINDSVDYQYVRPHFGDPFKNTLNDIYLVPLELTKKENVPAIIAVTLSTAIFIHYDEVILEAAQRFGRYVGISDDNKVYNISPSNKIPIYVPASLSAGMYYIGDGITELMVNGSFFIYGVVKDDMRALATASELTEGIATVGFYVQLIKHLSCRESPSYRTVPGGKWRWFSSIKEYYKCVPAHDAFPSGHLATAMMTTTIVSMNYPEYRFVKPLCYSLMGVCGFQMLNNGVHWIGDYPLAIALGYSIGRIAVNRGRNIINHSKAYSSSSGSKYHAKVRLFPVIFNNDIAGMRLSLIF